MQKTCTKCGDTKPCCEFSNDKSRKDGKYPHCKECVRAKCKQWRESNKDAIREKKKQYREANLERIRDRDRRYYQENKDSICDRVRDYNKENAEIIRERRKQYRLKYRHLIRERRRRHYAENRERLIEISRQYQKANRAKRRAYWHEYKHRPDARLNKALRSVLSEFCRRAKRPKSGGTSDLLGYTPEQLRQRMECQFKPGMSWDNHGEWHIDHKIPVSRFVERGEIRAHIVNALSNLQPLWAEDNMSKKNRWAG